MKIVKYNLHFLSYPCFASAFYNHKIILLHFQNFLQLKDISVARKNENIMSNISASVYFFYILQLDALLDLYKAHLESRPTADMVLAEKLIQEDFREFLLSSQQSANILDIASFIHLPAQVPYFSATFIALINVLQAFDCHHKNLTFYSIYCTAWMAINFMKCSKWQIIFFGSLM